MLKLSIGKDQKIKPAYFISILAAVLFTWFLHEFAHWAVSEWLGYDTILTLNGTYPVAGEYDKAPWHFIVISAAGPLMTLLQAIAVYGHLKYNEWVKYFYPLLFTPFYMRALAGIMNFINLNDEGRISNYWGIGTYTLPLLISMVLFLMVYKVSRQHHLSVKFQLVTFLSVMVVSSVLILADQALSIRII